MSRKKEDRSDWVAVQPEFTAENIPGTIRPAATAYQIFQRETASSIRQGLINQEMPHDVGTVTKAVSEKWRTLDADEKERFLDLARQDVFRLNQESHIRDVQAMERQEKLRRERDSLVYDPSGARSTRAGRRKEERKRMKQSRKKEERQKQQRVKTRSDSESEFEDEDESESQESYNSESEEESDSDDSSDSDKRPKKKARAPPQLSKAVIERREKARAERDEKEKYISERQADLRKDRADQAKRRLDFLLKQSDIFSHFGEVKEDKARLKGGSNRAASKTDTNPDGSHRRDDVEGQDALDEIDLQEKEEESTFLMSQPTTLGFGKMRSYQLEGLNWMIRLQENGVNGILADEMGLGKTLQSISVLVYMDEFRDVNGPHLIVVPKSTLSNWMAELERWAPRLTAVRFHGNKEEREDLAKNVLQPGQRYERRQWHVCVTTYEICNIEKLVLSKFAWSYLIIDEAHRLKNEASAFSKTIRSFETRYRLLLTGTPLQNNLHELWALLNFLVPDVFANAQQFDDWFNLDIDDADEKNKLISQLHKILRPFMLRRLKVDVEKNLPPKHETILFTGMSAIQKKLYKDILMRDIDVLQGGMGLPGGLGGGGSGGRTAILNIVMQLRKCAGHPYLFPGVEDRTLPPLGEHLVENCGKMVLLDKLLLRLKEKGHRVLLFTQMTRILDILEDYMVMRQFAYCRIDGNTTYEEREGYIEAYNAPNSEKFIFLLSTRAGGLGINLQTADVVILYDSDWNPQADLQAQDRAHRIGQKREVQVFRLVTQDTIEEKVVERAQQKLKLDAMVVQQGRLKEKDKLSRNELVEAIRFGADKVFKSKDSSITEDDIDMILNIGKQKTQELNEKLKNAEKGDLLDFKLDGGGMSAQTFEGVDYSQQGREMADAKAAQLQAELLGIMDIGKRERKTVANYNENQLYQQQLGAIQKERPKKESKLPKFLRLPKMEDWQMFDRDAIHELNKEEVESFRALSEDIRKKVVAKFAGQRDNAELDEQHEDEESGDGNLPLLLREEKQALKEELLAEGFRTWNRQHYSAFVRASAKFGRNDFVSIATEVMKSQSAVEKFARAFWDVNRGKARFSETEYDRVVKLVERGEKKIEETKGLLRGTRVLISLFENPWMELEFNHVNCNDKMFTEEEDRYLLCWSYKYGYGQWDSIKMAIRRSPDFRFDYFLKSLSVDAIARRCEQLMKAAEKEVEHLENLLKEESLRNAESEQLPGDAGFCITRSKYQMLMSGICEKESREKEAERNKLEEQVGEIEAQMRTIQEQLRLCEQFSNDNRDHNSLSNEFPDELIGDLINLVAKSNFKGIVVVASEVQAQTSSQYSKRSIMKKIEEVATKEKREGEGDKKPSWYIRSGFTHLLDAETLRFLRKEKEEKLRALDETQDLADSSGAPGPDGSFVSFPEYNGEVPPYENKKAFTHFCKSHRREVKASMDPDDRRDKRKVNAILKDRWLSLTDDEKSEWRGWETWDEKRYARDEAIFAREEKKRNHAGRSSEEYMMEVESSQESHLRSSPNKSLLSAITKTRR